MKKVLLLGAGYANLALIKNLPKTFFSQNEVILISEKQYHYTSVLLHEVVSHNQSKVNIPLSSILPNGVKFIQDTIKKIEHQLVIGEQNTYTYDTLVVGLGFCSDHFGIKGIQEYALPIVNYEGSVALHQRIKQQIQAYQQGDSQALHIVVCGGGFSGIELISSLAEDLPKLCQIQGVNPNAIKLTCIEAMPNILPMFGASLVQSAMEYLQKLKVNICTKSKILECQENGVIIQKEDGQEENIYSALSIWTAGVKGNTVIEQSEFFTSGRSKVEVNNYLQPINQNNQEYMEDIFVLGDCAALKDPQTQRFYPPTAQIAVKQGEYLAQVLPLKLKGQPISHSFTYQPQGTICSLGNSYAIGLIGQKEVKGKIAMWFKRLVEASWKWKIIKLFS